VAELSFLDPGEFVRRYAIRSLVCAWSGGRSSLAATHYTLSRLKDVDIEKYVVTVDTGVMIPDAIEFVKRVAEEQGWTLRILRPKVDFWQYSMRYGTPGIKRRWCCKYLKLFPMFEFVKQLPLQRAMVIGFRKDERRRSRQLAPQVRYQRRIQAWVYLPIKAWTKEDVRRYLKANSLPEPPWYARGIKETCICGAYIHRKELLCIKAHYPGLFEKLQALDRQRRLWGRCAFWDKGPVDLDKIAKQRSLKDFLLG
jgi:3'-phosphoadenosine 5'-phosphosulfate sulfotransferase (PAPS reductase)/FAD synthetase